MPGEIRVDTEADNFDEEVNKYDANIIVEDEKDYKEINPEYYIKRCIIMSQNALNRENLDLGLMQYRMIIEDMEMTANANNMLDESYFTIIEDFIKNDSEYNNHNLNIMIRESKLANKKKYEIMKRFFSRKTINDTLLI
jgi:hypothetical protein